MRKWLVPALATLLAALLLYALAWQLTRQGIDRQARAKATVFAAGHTPWDFVPRVAADLVAGHAFGDATLSHDSRGLIARSTGGQPYQLGVPLPYPVDLQRFPRLRMELDTEAATRLRLLLRRSLDSPLLESGEIDLPPGTHDVRIVLRDLQWTRLPASRRAAPPATAAMLRLQLRHPANTMVRWRALLWKLERTLPGEASGTKVDSGSPLRGVRNDGYSEGGNAGEHLGTAMSKLGIPVVRLAPSSVEALLVQRDAIRDSAPATVVVACADALKNRTAAARDPALTILALVAYGLFLLWVVINTRRRQVTAAVRRVLPAVQIAVCAGPMLAFAIGMYGSPGPGPVWLAVISAGLAVALWLAWRGYGEHWRWLHWQGHMAWRDWAMPALTTAAAAGLLLAYAAEPQLPSPRRIIGYGLWAGLQQLLILAALAPRLRSYCTARWLCALGLAVIFALAHAPNAMLMELTLLAEWLWAWQFLRRPVLLPIILAHATAGLLLAMGIAELPLRSLEIGSRFLQ